MSEPIRRWREGDILFVENEFVRLAFVVTDDPNKVGSTGWHGPDLVCVEYISAEIGRLWREET